METGTTSATATIEFDNKDDVLTAKTKDLKSFDGREIRVESGAGSTLYVTNYPPKADKEYMHDLFGKVCDRSFIPCFPYFFAFSSFPLYNSLLPPLSAVAAFLFPCSALTIHARLLHSLPPLRPPSRC